MVGIRLIQMVYLWVILGWLLRAVSLETMMLRFLLVSLLCLVLFQILKQSCWLCVLQLRRLGNFIFLISGYSVILCWVLGVIEAAPSGSLEGSGSWQHCLKSLDGLNCRVSHIYNVMLLSRWFCFLSLGNITKILTILLLNTFVVMVLLGLVITFLSNNNHRFSLSPSPMKVLMLSINSGCDGSTMISVSSLQWMSLIFLCTSTSISCWLKKHSGVMCPSMPHLLHTFPNRS